MITSPEDYLNWLHLIYTKNKQYQILHLPDNEPIYPIDLDTRIIKSPPHLGVLSDHEAEIVYFEFDRYHDNQDLAQTCALIIFKNLNDPEKKTWVTAIPFMDVFTKHDEQKVLIPWVIQGPVTKFSGTVEFAIQFYTITPNLEITYKFNTQSATSKVLKTLDPKDAYENTDEYIEIGFEYENIMARLNALETSREIYWDDLD